MFQFSNKITLKIHIKLKTKRKILIFALPGLFRRAEQAAENKTPPS
jgi:hypothetical protein